MWQSISRGHAAVEEAVRQFLPPCQIQCPINEDIQRTNVLISLLPEDPDLAREGIIQIGDYLYEKNPLFTICGYVCGLCELECNYQSKGGAIKAQTSQAIYLRHLHLLPRQKRTFSDRKKQSKGGRCRRRTCRSDVRLSSEQKRARSHHFRGFGSAWGSSLAHSQVSSAGKGLTSAIDNLVRIAGIEVKYHAIVGQGDLTLDGIKQQGFEAVFVARGRLRPGY